MLLESNHRSRLLINLRKTRQADIHVTTRLGKMSGIEMETAQCSLVIGQQFYTRSFCLLRIGGQGKLCIGNNVFFNSYCSVTCMYDIEIGENVMLGEGVKIYDHNHAIEKTAGIKIQREELTYGKVTIGRNSWLGANVVVLKGVTIGENVVIGANCLIYKDVPSNSIVKCSQTLDVSDHGS